VVLVDGGGVAIVGPDENAEPGRTLLEVEDAGRAGLEDDGFDGLDDAAGERPPLDPEPDDDPDDDPEPDGVPDDVEGADAGDDARAEAAGAEAEEARAVGEAGAEDDAGAAVAAAGAEVDDVGAAEDGAGRPPEAPALDGVADRGGTDDGRGGDEGVERDGVGVERAVAGADDAAEGEPARPEPAGAEPAGAEGAGVAFAVTVGDVGLAGAVSGRTPVGRTRVVSSAPPSLGALDEALVDASVLIGTVPPPGICRDVLSDRWLLSELTCHLHAQAADEEPVDSTRDPARHRPTRTQDPPVRPILALRAWLDDSSPLMHLDRKCPR
jgi:hypothetical protein